MKFKVLVVWMFLTGMVYSQDLPPAELMPGEEEKVLIDVLIETTLLKAHFIQLASRKIDDVGFTKKWSQKEIASRKEKISFENFMKGSTVYNAFSIFSKEELEELINLSLKINSGWTEPKILFTIPMIEYNIDAYINNQYLR